LEFEKQVQQKQQMQVPVSAPAPVTPPVSQPAAAPTNDLLSLPLSGANQCSGCADAIEITQWPFPNAPGGFFRGRVLLFASRPGFVFWAVAAANRPWTSPSSTARSRESLDPALLTGQADMRVVAGLFEGIDAIRPENGPADPRPGGTLGNFTRWLHLHVSSAHEPGLVHRRTHHGGRRGLFVDSRAQSGDRFRIRGAAFFLKNAEAFNAGKIKDPSLVGVRAPILFTVRVELNHPTAFFPDICALPVTLRGAAPDD
jgi:hypothetical protein